MVARSQNILAQTNAPSQVSAKTKNKSFNHVQVNKVATREGINPFAGDLTNAFNNFFNKAGNALDTLQQSEFESDQIDAKREAVRRRTIGANDAKEMARVNDYDMDADKAMSSSTSEFAGQYGYSQAFQESYGQAIGGKMLADMQVESVGVPPEQFESWASEWWTKRFGKGTGSEVVDLQVQSAFNKQYQQMRVDKSLKTIENQREAALEAASNSAVTFTNQKGGWGHFEYNKLLTQVKGINPTMTEGKARAATLDILASASIAGGQKSIQNFLSFLDASDVSGDAGQPVGVRAPSLSERFPLDVAQLRQSVYAKQQAFVTMDGQKAAADFSTAVANAVTETDGSTANRISALKKLHANLGELANTPGVNAQMFAEAKGQLTDQLTTSRALAVNYARLEHLAQTGELHPALNGEETKKILPEMLGEFDYNFIINRDPNAGVRAGKILRAATSRFGNDILDDDVKDMITAGLTSADPKIQANAFNAVSNMSGNNMAVATQMMGEEFGKLNLLTAGSDGSIEFNMDMANRPDLIATRELVRSNGIESYFIEDWAKLKKEERPAALEEFYSGVSEQIEENFGLDDGFLFFGNGGNPNISDAAQVMLNKITEDQVVQMRNSGNGEVDPAVLKNRVASIAGAQLAINEGRLVPIRDVPNSTIPIANNVMNPSGIMENVIGNMNMAADSIPDGLRNLIVSGAGMGIIEDGDDININYNEMFATTGGNLYQVTSGGFSVTLPIGQEMTGNLQYREDGELYNWYQTEDNNERKFKLTGNIVTDEMLLKRYLHPAVRLVSEDAQPGQPAYYRLAIEPYFKDVDGETMMETELQSLSESSNWKPSVPDYKNMTAEEIQSLLF